MPSSSNVPVLHFIGSFWTGVILVSLIASVFFPGPRDTIVALGLIPYLLLWFVALLPGIGALYLAERMSGGTVSGE